MSLRSYDSSVTSEVPSSKEHDRRLSKHNGGATSAQRHADGWRDPEGDLASQASHLPQPRVTSLVKMTWPRAATSHGDLCQYPVDIWTHLTKKMRL